MKNLIDRSRIAVEPSVCNHPSLIGCGYALYGLSR
jgi:hypothetical protein